MFHFKKTINYTYLYTMQIHNDTYVSIHILYMYTYTNVYMYVYTRAMYVCIRIYNIYVHMHIFGFQGLNLGEQTYVARTFTH